MYMIQVTESKIDSAKEMCEKMLHCGGKLMSALEEMCEGRENERTYRHMREYDYDDYPYAERRGMHHYSRY